MTCYTSCSKCNPKLYALIERSPLPFADSSHATFNVEMWFLFREFFDGLKTDGAVKMSMKLLVKVNMSPLASSLRFQCLNIQSLNHLHTERVSFIHIF